MGTKAPSNLQKTTCQRTNSFNETVKYLQVSTSIPFDAFLTPYDIIRIHYFHCRTRGFFSPLQELFSNIALAAGTQDSSPVLDCWSWDYSQKEPPVPVSHFRGEFHPQSSSNHLSSPYHFIKQMLRHDVMSFAVLREVLSIPSEKTYFTGSIRQITFTGKGP